MGYLESLFSRWNIDIVDGKFELFIRVLLGLSKRYFWVHSYLLFLPLTQIKLV
jgi:hypothetical protein